MLDRSQVSHGGTNLDLQSKIVASSVSREFTAQGYMPLHGPIQDAQP